MEFFTNPNFMYALVVVGIFLTILALFSPGTGLLELGALFLLVIAGVAIFNSGIAINIWAGVILVIGVIPFVLAMRKQGRLFFMAMAIVAFELGSMYLFKGSQWWKPAVNPLFALLLIVPTSAFLWLGAIKVIEAEKRRPIHDLKGLIGQIGEAKTDVFAEGSVQVGGELWSATSDQPISAGSTVRVISRHGFTIKVSANLTAASEAKS